MKPFEIGLSLTGTVSAGAYTGGVIDFLIEALDQWEQEKEKNRELHGDTYTKWNTPCHSVVIKALSGASGGGVSCGLIFNSIGKEIQPVRTPVDGMASKNDFYNAWVNMLGIEELLQVEDLAGGRLRSVFNANAIPAIADKMMKKELFGNKLSRKYIDPNLTALITLTNLRGIPFNLSANGAPKPVMYTRHTDYAQFELSRGSVLANNGSYLIPYDTANGNFSTGYAQLRAACLATCAFPAAFMAQPFNQAPAYYYRRNKKYKNGNGLSLPEGISYDFLCSDGGILNTEPFEILRQFMLPAGEDHNKHEAKDVERSILMVAPLQTFKEFKKEYTAVDKILPVLGAGVVSIRQEALFSAEQIEKAFDESYYSRFMIAPVRNDAPGSPKECLPAITGTALGDFGAFLSRDFRVHDYFLGRRNAQWFLKKHFALPVEEAKANEIFAETLKYSHTLNDYEFTDGGVKYFPIIPLCGTAKEEAYFPQWPKDALGKAELEDIEDKLKWRFRKVSDIAIDSIGLGWLIKGIAGIVVRKFSAKLAEKAMQTVKTELCKNDLASYKILE